MSAGIRNRAPIGGGVRVLGGVENMSGFACPHCGERIEVFPPVSEERSVLREVTLLGEIPLDPAYARLNGVPPEFAAIAERVEHALA